MPEINTLLPYIYGATSIVIIVLLWIAYMVFKLKRRIWKELDNEKQVMQPQYQQYPQQQYQNY